MKVRVLAMVLSLAALHWGGALNAQNVPQTQPPPDSEQIRRNAVDTQQEMARQFSEFQKNLQNLKGRLDRSANLEDRDRAAQLQKVLDQADSAGIRVKFAKLNEHLQKEKFDVQDFKRASDQISDLHKDLSDLVDLFNNTNRLSEEIKALKEMIERIGKLAKDERRAESQTRGQKTGGDELRDLQNKITKETQDVVKDLNPNQGQGQPGEGQPGDGKSEPKDPGKGDGNKSEAKNDGKNDGKNEKGKDDPSKGKNDPNKNDPNKGKNEPGKSEPGKSDGKGEPGKGEPSDGKAEGEAKSGDPMDGESGAKAPPGPPMPPMPGRPGDDDGDPSAKGGGAPPPGGPMDEKDMPNVKKQVQDALEKMKKAEKKLKKDDPGAADDQGEAAEALEQAKKELEKRLKALRDEELERLLANLKSRCELMLAMQIEVLSGADGTIPTYQAIQSNPGRQLNDINRQASLRLSQKEKDIIEEATKAIQILEGEGTGVAFPVAFQQLREDMKHVYRRLEGYDPGPITQAIEKDIIATLKEMIEALTKKQQDMQPQPPMPPMPMDPMPPPDPKLLDKIAELKMIRSMQQRLNDRTEMYSRVFPGQEQPPANDLNTRREISDLAERQERIFQITNKIQKGDNN